MKARTLRRHMKESLRNLARNGWMTFASVSAVTVTLLLVGVFFVIMMNLNKVATDIEEDVSIRVHIDIAATKEDQDALKNNIEKISEVDSVVYSPKEDELNNLISSLGEEGEAFKLFEQDNPLYDVFIVKTKQPEHLESVAKKIEKLDFAFKVRYGQDDVEKLFSFIKTSRNVGLVLIVGLLFTAMFLISNTIKITIVARRKEIEIMKLVGATNSFIRWPFFMEGLMLGILGSVIPISFISMIYRYSYEYISSKLQGHFIQLLEFNPFMFQVGGLLVLLGALIGIWGSVMSVRKFLKV
ncbi:permease-like cell division protein FtsX [Robertmurraya sp. DFI.2.37]|uniref:permease-like cell division protein FtsX n=1 Tax=Robertmurraya sp. DFI.2.37 TaxID=3031819 RepID=UPI0012485730|nr:permease-like cell division protein FtsX [Robertmurraya sp. DFI.2.37]MDF1507875.1 permease-like cell division protein FtsX [Robertmurraya sp. DFI.2.37]